MIFCLENVYCFFPKGERIILEMHRHARDLSTIQIAVLYSPQRQNSLQIMLTVVY